MTYGEFIRDGVGLDVMDDRKSVAERGLPPIQKKAL